VLSTELEQCIHLFRTATEGSVAVTQALPCLLIAREQIGTRHHLLQPLQPLHPLYSKSYPGKPNEKATTAALHSLRASLHSNAKPAQACVCVCTVFLHTEGTPAGHAHQGSSNKQENPCERLQGTAFKNPTHTGTASAQRPALTGLTHTHTHTLTHTCTHAHTHTHTHIRTPHTHTHTHTRTHTQTHTHTHIHTHLHTHIYTYTRTNTHTHRTYPSRNSVMLISSSNMPTHFLPHFLTESRCSWFPRPPFTHFHCLRTC
jgi:hypothetical protein